MSRAATVLVILLLASCTIPYSDPEIEAPPLVTDEANGVAPVTAVYHCPRGEDSFVLVTRTRPGGISLFLPPDVAGPDLSPYQTLQETSPGRIYTGDQTQLVLGERSAELSIGENTYPHCQYDHGASIWEHAKLNGVDFRAVGNEPGWVLEVREQSRLDFNYDYGAGQLSLPITETLTDVGARQTRYLAEQGNRALIVTLIGERCRDTMSDDEFETRVQIELDGRLFRGCGRPLH